MSTLCVYNSTYSRCAEMAALATEHVHMTMAVSSVEHNLNASDTAELLVLVQDCYIYQQLTALLNTTPKEKTPVDLLCHVSKTKSCLHLLFYEKVFYDNCNTMNL